MNRNIYLDGMMGLIVGDALGVPYEFSRREKLAENPATDMIGYGTYDVPAGTWSDDSSMALATLDSLRDGYDPEDIMINFADWLNFANYTPYEKVFDAGGTCVRAIGNYVRDGDIKTCGCRGENDNGNGSLMRILPACIYFYEKEKIGRLSINEIIEDIHTISALTHAHLRRLVADRRVITLCETSTGCTLHAVCLAKSMEDLKWFLRQFRDDNPGMVRMYVYNIYDVKKGSVLPN